jgi:hypothetical protein
METAFRWRTDEQQAEARGRINRENFSSDALMFVAAIIELCETIDDAAEYLSADLQAIAAEISAAP